MTNFMNMKLKIKKGDKVRVLAGKDKGKEGEIIQVFPKLNKAVVDKVNIYKKHLRGQKRGQAGQTIEFSAPVYVSNLGLICQQCGKVIRVGFKKSSDGTKVRMCKKCKRSI